MGPFALARIPVECEIASEFRYRAADMPEGGLALFISQSGETADTLAALRYARSQGQHIAVLVNQPESSMAREADVMLQTLCGPEIGVASTKAFTAQLTALYLFAMYLAQARGAILAVLEERGVPVFEYKPSQVKVILTGYGNADKAQIARMLAAQVKIPEGRLDEHARDAIAIAICHARSRRFTRAAAR